MTRLRSTRRHRTMPSFSIRSGPAPQRSSQTEPTVPPTKALAWDLPSGCRRGPLGPRNVETMNPVAQRLTVHAADLRGLRPILALANRRHFHDRRRRLWLTSFDLASERAEALPPGIVFSQSSPLMAWRRTLPRPKESEISPCGNPLHESVRGAFGITGTGGCRRVVALAPGCCVWLDRARTRLRRLRSSRR